ncbi:MAG: SDR family oxidoreductase [Kiritimatiellae bacterium]|nr:SDR family oxidoreductase [Kiritimatiellia bacterium]
MQEVVIISGASSGIGQSTARHLAKAGFRVFAGVRKEKDIVAWKGQEGISPVLLDVTSESSLEQAFQQLKIDLEKAPKVHLVNNAGIALAGPVEGVPLSRWREQFEVNVFGLVATTQKFLPFLRKTKGRIVNISSISGVLAVPYLAPYAASKFAVEAISDSLRRELRQFGCEVIVLEPGPVKTSIWKKSAANLASWVEGMPAEILELYKKELESFFQMAQKSSQNTIPAEKIARVLLQSLRARKPKTRYVVGDASVSIQAALLPFLSDRILDRLIAKELR